MAHHTIHSGQFLSRAGVAWQVDIWQELSEAPATVGELIFPADEPVVIEWDTKAKEEVICGSSATIRIESPGDRTYIGLYTVKPGEIGVNILRRGAGESSYSLYWVGTLDPEQYEEPYERASRYDVMLTFQDFGVWNRLRYNLQGMQLMGDIIRDARTRAGLDGLALDVGTLVSSVHIDERVAATPSSGSSSSGSSSSGSSSELAVIDSPAVLWRDTWVRVSFHEDTFIPESVINAEDTSAEGDDDSARGPVAATIDTMMVQSANFYDEDGEGLTLAEVVEGMLQPLGQRIIQRGGKIWVHDLQGIADNAGVETIRWTGDSQTLGTDAVYNKIKVTLDPNADGTLIDSEEADMDGVDECMTNVSGFELGAIPAYHTYYSGYQKDSSGKPYDPTDLQFTIFYSGPGHGLAFVSCAYFKMVGLLGGSDKVGVVGHFFAGHSSLADTSANSHHMVGNPAWENYTGGTHQPILMRTRRVYIPPMRVTAGGPAKWLLRLRMEVLFDPRYNPFTDADNYNEKGNYNTIKDGDSGYAYVFVPCDVRLWDSEEGGTLMAYYNNRDVACMRQLGSDKHIAMPFGYWQSGNAPAPSTYADARCWLAWYDKGATGSRRGTSGILGWKANRHQIGARDGELMASMTDIPDGEYIPYPVSGGWLEVSVWDNFGMYRDPANTDHDGTTFDFTNAAYFNRQGVASVHQSMRWRLFAPPEIDIVSGGVKHDIAEADDVETARTALDGAEEDLELDTICGVLPKETPSARAQIFRSATNLPLSKLRRCGQTDTPENLLTRTLAAQYGTRHTILSGEAKIRAGAPAIWVEQNQGTRGFMLLGEAQNLIEDTTEGDWCELAMDDGLTAVVSAAIYAHIRYDY